MFKRILNTPERTTHELLRDACSRRSAEVFAKIRVADILPIENSGISDTLFRFALQSHFDFVVADKQQSPLFAVEFDGPTHREAIQIERDSKKDTLCNRFGFPMLRINAGYINRKYRNLHLLTWFVEVWFFYKAVEEGQQSGALPADEDFCPFSEISIPRIKEGSSLWLSLEPHLRSEVVSIIEDSRSRPALWLSKEPRLKLIKLHNSGIVATYVPSVIIGRDENGMYRRLSFIRMGEQTGVFVTSEMTSQRFCIHESEALHEILPFLLHERVVDAVNGDDPALSWKRVKSVVEGFRKFLRTICSEVNAFC